MKHSPSPFTSGEAKKIIQQSKFDNIQYFDLSSEGSYIDSASKGISLLLSYLHLKPNSKVGLSPLICPTVAQAIEEANLIPCYIDIDLDTFQMKFDIQVLDSLNLKCLIIPHLYGSLYPFFEQVVTWAERNHVPLINDAAQSSNVKYRDKPIYQYGFGGVISFGPGKASMAAGGAYVYSKSRKISIQPLRSIISTLESKYFLKDRTSSSKMSVCVLTLISIYRRHFMFKKKNSKEYLGVNKIQYSAIQKFFEIEKEIKLKRDENWNLFDSHIDQTKIFPINSYRDSAHFKYVFYLDKDKVDINKIIDILSDKKIPIRDASQQYLNKIPDISTLPVFANNHFKILEMSTERNLSKHEIIRYAQELNKIV